MNRRVKIGALTVAGLLLLTVAGVFVFIWSGAYNVAATEPHTDIGEWLLNTTMERSVAARADDIPAPPPVNSDVLQRGFEEYHEMCVVCHGAPGVERSALGKGIHPEPPDLAEEAAEWNDRELFWIVKHGIKMAGMPAFGVTHSDEELWSIVAFVRRLDDMLPAQYRGLVAEAEARGGVHGAQVHAKMDRAKEQPHAMHGVPARPQAGMQQMDHARLDHARTRVHAPAMDRHVAEPEPGDVETTSKLKTLVAELVSDPVVQARIRADSALRRRWENENVRSQLSSIRH